MNKILQEQRTDIIMYVFQIYAALVSNSSSNDLGETYSILAKSTLEDASNTDPEMRYLVPGQIKLLCSIMYKFPAFFENYFEHVFGLFEKVLATLKLESDALELLSCIIEVFPLETIGERLVTATKAVFQHLYWYKSASRRKFIPEDFKKAVFVFSSRFILNHGTERYMALMDSVQKDMIFNFFEKHAHCIGKIGRNDPFRRNVLAAFCIFVIEVDSVANTPALHSIVQGLIENICPTSSFHKSFITYDDSSDMPVEYQTETGSFDRASFQPLYSITIRGEQKLPEGVENYTEYVLQCIQALVEKQNQDFMQHVGKELTKETQNYFTELLQKYTISL